MEERIGGLGFWDDYVRRVICKGLDMSEDVLHVMERRRCVIC